MRIEREYFGDWKVQDEVLFTAYDIHRAAWKVFHDHGEWVFEWPLTVEERHGFWELWFYRPQTKECNNY
jgi:hypothetical protein